MELPLPRFDLKFNFIRYPTRLEILSPALGLRLPTPLRQGPGCGMNTIIPGLVPIQIRGRIPSSPNNCCKTITIPLRGPMPNNSNGGTITIPLRGPMMPTPIIREPTPGTTIPIYTGHGRRVDDDNPAGFSLSDTLAIYKAVMETMEGMYGSGLPELKSLREQLGAIQLTSPLIDEELLRLNQGMSQANILLGMNIVLPPFRHATTITHVLREIPFNRMQVRPGPTMTPGQLLTLCGVPSLPTHFRPQPHPHPAQQPHKSIVQTRLWIWVVRDAVTQEEYQCFRVLVANRDKRKILDEIDLQLGAIMRQQSGAASPPPDGAPSKVEMIQLKRFTKLIELKRLISGNMYMGPSQPPPPPPANPQAKATLALAPKPHPPKTLKKVIFVDNHPRIFLKPPGMATSSVNVGMKRKAPPTDKWAPTHTLKKRFLTSNGRSAVVGPKKSGRAMNAQMFLDMMHGRFINNLQAVASSASATNKVNKRKAPEPKTQKEGGVGGGGEGGPPPPKVRRSTRIQQRKAKAKARKNAQKASRESFQEEHDME